MGVREYSNEDILDRLPVCAGWKGLPDGVLDVWVRSDEDAYNKFDDKVYTFECKDGAARFVMMCTGTSNAGSEGLKNFSKYNREGCAILDGDRIVYDSHHYGLHKGKYPAYRQTRGFPYYRDNDRDNRAEELGKLHNEIIGANCHKAGWLSTAIGGWSVACLVRNNQAEYDKWMRFMNKRPLTVAILNEWTPEAEDKTLMLSENEVAEVVDGIREEPDQPLILDTPEPAAVAVPLAQAEPAQADAAQFAENISNVAIGDKNVPDNFVAENKTVTAPEPSGILNRGWKWMLGLGLIPTTGSGLIETFRGYMADGSVNWREVIGGSKEVFLFLLPYLFWLGIAFVVFWGVKELLKQISFMVTQYTMARGDMNNVFVRPAPPQPTPGAWRFSPIAALRSGPPSIVEPESKT